MKYVVIILAFNFLLMFGCRTRNNGMTERKKMISFLRKEVGHQYFLRLALANNYHHPISLAEGISIDSIENMDIPRGHRWRWDTIWDPKPFNDSAIMEYANTPYRQWKRYGWSRQMPFETFLRYILPSDGLNEEAGAWRDLFAYRYGSFVENIPRINGDTPRAIYQYISRELSAWKELLSNGNNLTNHPQITSGLVQKASFLGQVQTADTLLVALRSVGVAAASEWYPWMGKRNGGGAYIALIDAKGSFKLPWDDQNIFKYKIPKAYRRESWRCDSLYNPYAAVFQMGIPTEDIPLSLNIPMSVDITAQRTVTANIRVPAGKGEFRHQVAYLGVFNDGAWQIIAWGKIIDKTREIIYKNIGRGILYHLMDFRQGRKYLSGSAFVLDTLGRVIYFHPDTRHRTSITITNSDRDTPLEAHMHYVLFYWDDVLHDWSKVTDLMGGDSGRVAINDVPADAIYRVHKVGSPGEERVFTLDKGIQLWW